MGFEDDAPTDWTDAWCSQCGRPLEELTGMCAHCRHPNIKTTKARRRTLADRRAERAKTCTVCGRTFAKDDERVLVRMPRHIHPDWTPRTTTVHEACAPLAPLWPAYIDGVPQ